MAFYACDNESPPCDGGDYVSSFPKTDSLREKLNWPEDLDIAVFAGSDITPSPACLAVSPTGEVFVGVDKMGSLGKEMNQGSIVKIIDCNHDGIIDQYTAFAQVDNPRGIIAIGDQVFVLHTRFSKETEKAENMDLIVFEDLNRDGIADGPADELIRDLSNPAYLQQRGTDHATNGIQLGIDGWIYIAVGDFGFYNATDKSGKQLTMLGGGIVRVRPDGTEMEVYTHGLRNIYDVAIDPLMNIFTRGNTNDGGGWNVRFAHQIQSGEYGYPMLFKHFTEEIIPALIDVGGGSGTGALYLDDDRWPAAYNHQPLMADWGRNQLYIHSVSPDQGSFTQTEKPFITLPQITDVDIDGSGAMYLSAWDGAGYSGSPNKGYVVRVIPKSMEYETLPDLGSSSVRKLIQYLQSNNAKTRQYAQYELLNRPKEKTTSSIWKIVKNANTDLAIRVAALYTYSQIMGKDGQEKISTLLADNELKPHVIRTLTDRLDWAKDLDPQPFLSALNDESIHSRLAAIIGLGRIGNPEAANPLLNTELDQSFVAPAIGTEGKHANPNASLIPAHLAVQSLVKIGAIDPIIQSLKTDNRDLALWAMRYIHDKKIIEALIQSYDDADIIDKHKIVNTLARLYFKEQPYDASWWWSTRPDTHGPYYKTMEWEESPLIREFLVNSWKSDGDKDFYTELNTKYRLGIDDFGIIEINQPKEDAPAVDLEKLKNKKGQIGKASIEDIMLALQKLKGDAEQGKLLFAKQGCPTCHAIDKGEIMKGPFMGQIGSIMNRQQIAESIIKPNASISQGFSTVQISTKNGDSYVGFVTEESADELVIRNIVGQATTIKTADITQRKEMESSMMPAGLANALSYEEFASLVAFLSQQK
ncbi:hypothetical protein GCM10025777_06570 [Membranihabitans marinus]